MSKRIFVSRSLSKDSPIRKVAHSHEITDRSLIQIQPLPFSIAPDTTWLFFYSKNGVKIALNQVDLRQYKLGAIGKGTANLLMQEHHNVDFIGQGDNSLIASAFSQCLKKDDHVVFLRALHSQDSVKSLMNCHNCHSIPVYSNELSDDVPLDDFDVLIFTSSRNAKSYFKKKKVTNKKIIAIGTPTQKTLEDLGCKNIILASSPSESGIADVLSLLLS